MKTTARILLIEDDPLQARETVAHLEEAFTGPIRVLTTESELVQKLPAIAQDPPDVFVIDVNLRWANPSPEILPPSEIVLEEGKQFAGFRCCELLAECRETRHIPVIIYSIFDRSHYEHRLRNLSEWVVYIPKDNLLLLTEAVRQLLATYRDSNQSRS
jgi:DNA-binding NarL/FixJ family response regulator